MAMIYPVILCGGSGTRLWPVSRQSMPKQFMNLVGEKSLFQQAAQRISGSQFAKPLVITSNDYRFIVAQQLADIGVQPNGVMLEPSAKNTAPAILAAAEFIYEQDSDALLLVMPADHFIPDQKALADLVLAAKPTAEAGSIITFGIWPKRPETGYGYIERGEALAHSAGYGVAAFHEKPDQKKAKAMLAAGTYFWNSGLFLTRCKTVLENAETFLPDMVASVRRAVSESTRDLDFLRLGERGWQDIQSDSIDYALLEKADNLVVFPFLGRWSDLGDWQALKRELCLDQVLKDNDENLLIGNSNQIDSQSCLIWSDNADQVVTGVGLKDTIVVVMKDAVLVIDAAKTQLVKDVVEMLDLKNHSQAYEHARQFRPWGWFETLNMSGNYQVRNVYLNPHAKISLQKHQRRSENWIVTSGEAEVLLDGKIIRLFENNSLEVPAGATHQLSNPTDRPLSLIEVRAGSYLGDDDAQRFDD